MSEQSSELTWLKWYLSGWGVLIVMVFIHGLLAEPESDFGLMLLALVGLLFMILAIIGLIRFIPWSWHIWRN